MEKKSKDVPIEGLNSIYRELAEIIGINNTIKIYENYKGLQVNFPTRIYSKEYVIEEAVKEYEKGRDIRHLAVEYNYSERWIREMIQVKKRREEKNKGDKDDT